MLTVKDPAELMNYVDKELGAGEWLTIDQAMIDDFARTTGDMNWTHVDVERARREMPGGKTIAHGYLTLSLIPRLSKTVYEIQQRGKGFNYGSNRIRFTSPVPVGSRIRLRETLKEAEAVENGTRLTFSCIIEVEGASRPAMLAETIVLLARD